MDKTSIRPRSVVLDFPVAFGPGEEEDIYLDWNKCLRTERLLGLDLILILSKRG